MNKIIGKVKRDWGKYNNSLVNRGYLIIFISKDFVNNWYVKYNEHDSRKKGGQCKYSEEAISSLLSLRFVFKQPIRSTEGFARSLVGMMGLEIDIVN